MPNYLCVYTGGERPAPGTEKEVMAAWMSWFGSVGDALVDGGAPLSEARKTIATDGTTTDGASTGLGGYSILRADDFDSALVHAKTCPHLASNGEIQIFETHQVEM